MEAGLGSSSICDACLQGHGTGDTCPALARTAEKEELPTAPPVGVAAAPDPLMGTQFGSFRLVRRLGRGGMGSVYLGEHVTIGSKVAVKVLHEHLCAHPELIQRFHAEARAVNLIGHENIVNIFDLDPSPPRPYLIMEYLEGSPLSARVGAPVPSEVWVPLLAQVCEALHAAHQRGIIHRDLKPDNVFLVKRDRGPDFVKVLDFGIAKLTDRVGPVTSSGVIIGTPEYMAPEQATGEPVDGRADLYAVGIIAYQLATGRLPFGAESTAALLVAHTSQPPPSPRGLCPRVSEPLERVILRALAKSPADRYDNARALRTALEEALAEEQRHPPPRATLPPPVARKLEFAARVALRPGAAPERLVVTDLSRGGFFLRTEGELPPLFSRLSVTLEVPEGPLTLLCEVVSHVTAEQARTWQMAPGFGVQFKETTPTLRLTLGQLLSGDPARPPSPAPPPSEDPEVRALLERHQARLTGDHYTVLGLAQDASVEAIRVRARELLTELGAVRRDLLPRTQRVPLDTLLARVREAGEVLSNLSRRAAYDARQGNFRGVACCLAAGLTATQLEALRSEFLLQRPNAAGTAHIHFLTGSALERGGQLAPALEAYERGLAVDPLELNLQQRYRLVRKALAGRASTP
jgi:serine/threonine-protein kinase